MRRFAIGLFFVLHGLAHAAIGMTAQDAPHGLALAFGPGLRVALATTLFVIAMPGFVAAGFGHWGVVGIRHWWRTLARVAAGGSLLLLLFFSTSPAEAIAGLVLDAVAVALTDPRIKLVTSTTDLRGAS
jgi:hypothetical protein